MHLPLHSNRLDRALISHFHNSSHELDASSGAFGIGLASIMSWARKPLARHTHTGKGLVLVDCSATLARIMWCGRVALFRKGRPQK